LDVFLIGHAQAINQRIRALENQINFLIESIKDTQSAIRAFDVKAGTLGVLLFIPIYKIDKFARVISNVRHASNFEILLFTLDMFLWIFSIFLVLMSLVSVSDPAEKIRGERPHGTFYSAYLFKMNWKQYILCFHCESTKTISEEIQKLPSTEELITSELCYEKMKLVYIRTLKSGRIKIGIWSTALWIFFTIYFYSIYVGKICH